MAIVASLLVLAITALTTLSIRLVHAEHQRALLQAQSCGPDQTSGYVRRNQLQFFDRMEHDYRVDPDIVDGHLEYQLPDRLFSTYSLREFPGSGHVVIGYYPTLVDSRPADCVFTVRIDGSMTDPRIVYSRDGILLAAGQSCATHNPPDWNRVNADGLVVLVECTAAVPPEGGAP